MSLNISLLIRREGLSIQPYALGIRVSIRINGFQLLYVLVW